MNREDIIKKLSEAYSVVMGKEVPENGWNMDTDLRTDMGLSSIGMLYFVITIESLFSIRFEGVGTSDFNTIGDVVAYIEEHTA